MIKVMTVVVALVIAPLALAGGESKIAVLDMQGAILNTSMAKSEMKAFGERADISKMSNDVEKLQKDITNLRAAAAKGGSDAQEKQKNIEFKQADLELIIRKLNAERQEAIKKLMDEIGPHLEAVVKGIIDADGIGLLLDKRTTIYTADPSFDITAKVTDKLNAASKK
jgi:outer membrane protein